GRGPRQFEPSPIHFVRFGRVDENIAVTIVGTRSFETDFLMPAMSAANRIGLDRESKILMNARIFPPYSLGIAVAARKWAYTVHLAHFPTASSRSPQVDQGSGPLFAADFFV